MTKKLFLLGTEFYFGPSAVKMYYDADNECISYNGGQWVGSVIYVSIVGFTIATDTNIHPYTTEIKFSDLKLVKP